MANWTKSQISVKGITYEIVEQQGRHGASWKRSDGFGHNSDQMVHEYKMLRRERNCYRHYAAACDKNPPKFDTYGALIRDG